MVEISLYFHIPFCTKKCPYCHFFVLKDSPLQQKRFLDALKQEWELRLPLLAGKKQELRIVSLYFGGGTASLLSIEAYTEIFSWLQPYLNPNTEITLEGNPESLSLAYLQQMHALGVNRVSIGVQTLDNELLKKIGRGHDATLAIQSVENAQVSGIENISIDLMYDLPGQTLRSFEETLREAVNLPITHLSLYNLTIEPYTPFYKKKEQLQKEIPSSDESFLLLQKALEILPQAGFIRYEISAFAKNSLVSRHNSGYWTARPFLGYGPSAFSYWDKSRFSNLSNLLEYEKLLQAKQEPVDFRETLPPLAQYNELLAIRLRLLDPYTPPSPIPIETEKSLQKLCQEGLVQKKRGAYQLTEKGTSFYDSVAEELIALF